jgi:hypothetical protein
MLLAAPGLRAANAARHGDNMPGDAANGEGPVQEVLCELLHHEDDVSKFVVTQRT